MTNPNEIKYYQTSIVRNNEKLQFINDVMTLTLGSFTGILKLEAQYGFLFYAIGTLSVNLMFYLICCGSNPNMFFENPKKEVFVIPLASNLAGFIMMWCLVYALVS